MEALSTHHAYQPQGSSSRTTGIVFVVGLHVLLVYGLLNGLHRDIIKIIPKVMVMVDVPEEIKEPPPPIKKIEPPTSKAPVEPTPEFMPPPEVQVENTSPVQMEATPVPTPVQDITPPATVVADTSSSTPTDIRLACPHMVKPDMPRQAVLSGTTGVVRATATIRGGAVTNVTNLTGPKVFYPAVKAAMLQYRCEASGEVTATQEFNFKLNE